MRVGTTYMRMITCWMNEGTNEELVKRQEEKKKKKESKKEEKKSGRILN